MGFVVLLTLMIWDSGTLANSQSLAADTVLISGKIITIDPHDSVVEALAIRGERIVAVGSTEQIKLLIGQKTSVIDLNGRTVIPGLIDSHIHAIRDALYYSSKVDWSGAPDVPTALNRIETRARTLPTGAWLIVIGGWHKNQFNEKRAPTVQELDRAALGHPIYVQHQFDFAIVNNAALQKLNFAASPLPTQLKLELDKNGEPSGIISADGAGNAFGQLAVRVLKPTLEEKEQSIPIYFAMLNQMGITGIVDQGDLGLEEYGTLFKVWSKRLFSVRVRYNFLTLSANAGRELEVTQPLMQLLPPLFGDEWLRLLGLGEIVIWSMYDGSLNAADVPRTAEARNATLKFATWAAAGGYSVDVHASHDSTVRSFLDIFEEVNRKHPIAPLRWKISHGEDITDNSLARMEALGMGLSVQDRMYFGGDQYLSNHSLANVRRAPPIVTASGLGVPVLAGTDATVVAPYNPFISLRWFIDGKTITGATTRAADELPSRTTALRMYTLNGAWGSFEEADRGSLEVGKLADLVVLDRDYLTIPTEDVGAIRPELTMVGGRIVYAKSR